MRRRAFITMLGGAAVWPLAARAQQASKLPTIGFLGTASPGPNALRLEAFRQGLDATGFVEGKNLAIEYRWAEGRYDRLPALAADLVGRKVDVIATQGGTAPVLAAKNASPTIPIVFVSGGDPIAEGLVTNLARPGGNITGVSWFAVELIPKLFELLSELPIRHDKGVTLLVNPNNAAERMVKDVGEAARIKGIQLRILRASNESEIDAAFAALVQMQAGGLVVGSDPFFGARREQIVALAARHAVPAIYDTREYTAIGGLISYGSNVLTSYRQIGVYAGRILKGEKPADLPVQQPTTFELVINLKTAKVLGLTIPETFLLRTNEVIE
jgi:putative ABC transport system substrate-binding protein